MKRPNEWQQKQIEQIAITLLLSGLLVLRAAGVWAAEQPEPIVVSLPDSYEVTSPTATVVTLGDLTEEITGGSDTEREALRAIPLLEVPDPGKSFVYTSTRIIAASRQNGFKEFRRLQFEGARNFKIFGLGSNRHKGNNRRTSGSGYHSGSAVGSQGIERSPLVFSR
ncbi:MAG: hypothetical protein ABIH23_11765 [bacterium]